MENPIYCNDDGAEPRRRGRVTNTNVGNPSGAQTISGPDILQHFEKRVERNGKEWMLCSYCFKRYVSTKQTSHLRRHMNTCASNRNRGGGGEDLPISGDEQIGGNHTADQLALIDRQLTDLDLIRLMITRGIRSLVSRKSELLKVYREEKEKFCNYLEKLPVRFSLAIDEEAIIDDAYIWITVSYIDVINNHWSLKNKMLGFRKIDPGSDYVETVKGVPSEWRIDRKLFSVIDDNNKDKLGDIQSWDNVQDSLPPGGHLIYAGSLNHMLSEWTSIVQGQADTLVEKIGSCVTCVNGPSVNASFKYAVQELGMEDDGSMPKKRTNNKIIMLDAALKFRPAFDRLKDINKDFDVNLILTDPEYNEAKKISDVLKCCKLENSKGRFLTPNIYIQIICEIYKKLPLVLANPVDLDSVTKIRDSFWEKYGVVLAIAAFLDPRFDRDTLGQWFEEIFDRDAVDAHLEQFFVNLFQFYKAYGGSGDINSTGSEYGEYMTDRDLIRTPNLDILIWWNVKAERFPTFARMAQDIFTIPFYTTLTHFGSELEQEINSAMGATEIDFDILEAYICLKSWLKN
ncbi:hypothetical protein Ddye_027361 [Dipteronia dyeriana]|uniref:BED-type domain-containing protein n=1 Tax=Dipteronia dyeriana TaxID=168575 RepID=A0AAD9TP49_9ROSI|nr:hypothetical protein Ddye_027361 [Dipteronia dyeriana]